PAHPPDAGRYLLRARVALPWRGRRAGGADPPADLGSGHTARLIAELPRTSRERGLVWPGHASYATRRDPAMCILAPGLRRPTAVRRSSWTHPALSTACAYSAAASIGNSKHGRRRPVEGPAVDRRVARLPGLCDAAPWQPARSSCNP